MQIIPAILPKDFKELEEKLEALRGLVSAVQIDICDGYFVKSKTWPYQGDGGEFSAILNEERGLPFWDAFDFEADLMVEEPEAVIHDYVRAGCSKLVVHLGSTEPDKLHDIFEEWGRVVDIWIGANVTTSTEDIKTFIKDAKGVQFMGIWPIGVQGNPFKEEVLEKIRTVRAEFPDVRISVDGGVTLQNAPSILEAGADTLVVGSAIWKEENIRGAVDAFKAL